jgi:D-alanine--poly(phosphoribitol) ligase subunit 1
LQSNILEWLEASARKYSDRPAFSDIDRSITFSEAAACARAIGSFLTEYVKPRSPVVVLTGRHAYTLVCFLGVVYAGCYYVPLDPESPADRLNTILRRLDSPVILTDAEHLSSAQNLDFSGSIVTMEQALEARPDTTRLDDIRSQTTDLDPLYVIFTSGSTGTPKGVVTTHRSMFTFITGLVEATGIDHTDIIGSQAPLDYVGVVKDFYAGLFTGAHVFIIPKVCFTVPENLFDLMNERRVTSIAWTVTALVLPTMQGIFDECSPPRYLKRVCFTGSVMPSKYLRIWQQHLPGVQFINLYGPTEVTACCSYYVVDRLVSNDDSIPIGVPFRNYSMFVLKDDNTEAACGELGELCVGGSAVAQGYYKDPELSSQYFVQNPLHDAYRDIVYRTGDLCVRRPDGNFEYHGRRDRQVKLHGYRIELGEVEESAKALAGIDDCCCLYDAASEQLCLFYSGSATRRDIVTGLRKKLPAYMIPRQMIRLEHMPLMPNMKIDMQKLKAMMVTEHS